MSKKFDKCINQVEMFYGDIIVEYGYADGADEEQVCSGEWEPSKEILRDAMVDCLNDHAGLTGEELQKCADYWFKNNYGN